jgi:hypothetical protein
MQRGVAGADSAVKIRPSTTGHTSGSKGAAGPRSLPLSRRGSRTDSGVGCLTANEALASIDRKSIPKKCALELQIAPS